jgi:catechol 2,3-dioxygenase-like lactoylglutathione lyase family enzyme
MRPAESLSICATEQRRRQLVVSVDPGRAVDVGVVTNDARRLVEFYTHVLGLEVLDESSVLGGTMYKLQCGAGLLKVLQPNKPTEASAPPGGIHRATGYRYWTVWVDDLHEIASTCGAAGIPLVVPPTEFDPGLFIAIVADPDGNWVELAMRTE